MPLGKVNRHGRFDSTKETKFNGITVAPVSPPNEARLVFRPPQNDAPVQRFVSGQAEDHLGDLLRRQQP
jgi:hypothetical protein